MLKNNDDKSTYKPTFLCPWGLVFRTTTTVEYKKQNIDVYSTQLILEKSQFKIATI